jgi:hypothetical protein
VAFSRRERAASDTFKKRAILRAKRSGWNALLGGSAGFVAYSNFFAKSCYIVFSW